MLLPGENVLSTQQGEKDNGRGRVDAMNFKNPYLWMFKKTTKKQEKSLGLGIAYRSLGSSSLGIVEGLASCKLTVLEAGPSH